MNAFAVTFGLCFTIVLTFFFIIVDNRSHSEFSRRATVLETDITTDVLAEVSILSRKQREALLVNLMAVNTSIVSKLDTFDERILNGSIFGDLYSSNNKSNNKSSWEVMKLVTHKIDMCSKQFTGVFVYFEGSYGLLTVAHTACNGSAPAGFHHIPRAALALQVGHCGQYEYALNISDSTGGYVLGAHAFAYGYWEWGESIWEEMILGISFGSTHCDRPFDGCKYMINPTYRVRAHHWPGMEGAMVVTGRGPVGIVIGSTGNATDKGELEEEEVLVADLTALRGWMAAHRYLFNKNVHHRRRQSMGQGSESEVEKGLTKISNSCGGKTTVVNAPFYMNI